MLDCCHRRIRYLRLSLTAACQMRCSYCRPAWLRSGDGFERLSPREIEALVRHLLIRHGVTKVRLTGGDPTARPDLLEIIAHLAAIPGIDDLAMTTNGLTLAGQARRYAGAGLGRVNVSLDSLDPAGFARITGVDALGRVIAGIDAAVDAGLAPLKINTVVLRCENEDQLPALVRFAVDRGAEIRFIELMPMGPLAERWSERYVPESVMRRTLGGTVAAWRPLPQGSGAARRDPVTLHGEQKATIGFITPMSCNFCAGCDRIRIAADGGIYPCLMDREACNLMPALRPDVNADELDRLLQAGLSRKAREHPATGVSVMAQIGG